jgi:predicted metal-binding membrane protein
MGLHCTFCCSSFMTILLVTGVMNLGIMALLTVAITAERLAPKPEWAARAAGAVTIASAIFMIARAANT